jgi:hypothetical protein
VNFLHVKYQNSAKGSSSFPVNIRTKKGSMKSTVSWGGAPYVLVELFWHFGGMSVNTSYTVRRHIPEDSWPIPCLKQILENLSSTDSDVNPYIEFTGLLFRGVAFSTYDVTSKMFKTNSTLYVNPRECNTRILQRIIKLKECEPTVLSFIAVPLYCYDG